MEISKTQLIVAGVIIILVVAIVGFMWWEKSKKTKLDKNKIDAPTKKIGRAHV